MKLTGVGDLSVSCVRFAGLLWLVLLLPAHAKAADKQIEAYGKTLAQFMGRLIREYDLTQAGEAATKALPNDPDFLKGLENRGINWKNPTPAEAVRIKQEMGEYLRYRADLKPELLGWLGLLESHGAPWSQARRHYDTLSGLRPGDALPRLVMLTNHRKQTEKDAEEWLEMLKEGFYREQDAEIRQAMLMIAAIELPDLARTNIAGRTIARLDDWLKMLDKSTAPPALARKIEDVQTAVALVSGTASPAISAEALELSMRLPKLHEAAAKGDAVAAYELGNMHLQGTGVARDHAKAMEWFRKADQQGLAKAARSIGHLYMMGGGVKTDHSEAARLVSQSGRRGRRCGR
jgi:hypothetical protein